MCKQQSMPKSKTSHYSNQWVKWYQINDLDVITQNVWIALRGCKHNRGMLTWVYNKHLQLNMPKTFGNPYSGCSGQNSGIILLSLVSHLSHVFCQQFPSSFSPKWPWTSWAFRPSLPLKYIPIVSIDNCPFCRT